MTSVTKMSAAHLLHVLGYGGDAQIPGKERDFAVPDVRIKAEEDASCMWRIDVGLDAWRLESKVVLSEEDLRTVANLVVRMAPVGSTARLQADAHRAGTVFVGLVLLFDTHSIPVNLVSGDIGCGLTLVPVVDHEGRHVTEDARCGDVFDDKREFYSYVLACMRRSLKRGNVAEKGLSCSTFIDKASAFYGDGELEAWLHEMAYILESVGVDYGDNVLAYISRFCQSLGSSGNHFMELAVDDTGAYWVVVHSGSRALGSMVYSAIAGACRATADGFEIATGPLAVFYARAYDALNKFAKLNRVICAVAVLEDLGMSTSASDLVHAMKRSSIFAPAVAVCPDEPAVMGLLGGLTHNGLKCFMNDEDKTVLYVLSKGAIAVSRRGSSAIVALRAGEGCVVFTLADPACPWREVPLARAVASGYTPVFDAGDGVVFAGHGAGRSQSTTATEQQSTFEDLMSVFEEHGVVGNIAPGILGDNPARAYKPSMEILQHLPLSEACTWSMLRTRVAHKEGLCYKKKVAAQCAAHIQASDYDADPLLSLWHDLNLVRGYLPDDEMDRRTSIRDAVMSGLCDKYRGPAAS